MTQSCNNCNCCTRCTSCITRIYKKFNYPGAKPGSKTLLTGIRPDACSNACHDTCYNTCYNTCHDTCYDSCYNVCNNDDGFDSTVYIITGFYESPGPNVVTTSFVYRGDLCKNGKFFTLNYPSTSQNVVNVTNLYGPNNGTCPNTYNIVGNYTLVGNSSTIGCLYQGPLNNTGTWTTIIPTPLSTSPILNTICHSNMGNLVVGNYDTQLKTGNAFIYDIKLKTYTNIIRPNFNILSITAYGIWYNGCESYTIAGGYATVKDQEVGYLVDYNRTTKTFSNWTTYRYNDEKNVVVTHFDGISSNGFNGCNGYTLTGDYVRIGPNSVRSGEQAFFVNIERDYYGKFCTKGEWSTLQIKGSASISGNTVSEDVVLGVFTEKNSSTVNGYVSTIINDNCEY